MITLLEKWELAVLLFIRLWCMCVCVFLCVCVCPSHFILLSVIFRLCSVIVAVPGHLYFLCAY